MLASVGPVPRPAMCSAILLLLSVAQIAWAQNAFLDASIVKLDADGNPVSLLIEKAVDRIGSTPAEVVIDKVVAFPSAGGKDSIVLRNIGGKTASVTGWKLTDKSGTEFVLEPTKECPQFASIAPAESLELTPKDKKNPCGFPFNLSFQDSIKLMDAEGKVIHGMEWETFEKGSALRRQPDGTYIRVPEDSSILNLLSSLGDYKFFLEALKVTGLEKALTAAADPDYTEPSLPAPPPPPPFKPFFPPHFGFAVDRAQVAPPPPPPPPPVGIPKKGPYTVFAPNDQAFEDLRLFLSGFGQEPFTREQVLELPEMVDIIKYHIVGGAYTSDFLLNNTEIFTSLGAELVPFDDPILTEGKVMLHDSCVDKPTLDIYDCAMQKEFGKCFEPFMLSPLAAQWRGGLCERTCGRCTCEFGQCATIQMLDLEGSNGVVHTIDRVMFPPPIFKKEDVVLLSPEDEEPDVNVVQDLEGKFEPTLTIGFAPRKTTTDNSKTGRGIPASG